MQSAARFLWLPLHHQSNGRRRLLPLLLQQHRRSASQFKRTINLNLQPPQQNGLRTWLQENRPLTSTEWHRIRTDILTNDRQITEVNVDATILGQCIPDGQLLVAKSYVRYLQEIGVEPNVASLGRLLRLYHIAAAAGAGSELNNEDQMDIIRM